MDKKARERKRRQRARAKSAGLVRIETSLRESEVKKLRESVDEWDGDLAREITSILRIEIPKHLDRLDRLSKKIRPLSRLLDKYRDYADKLQKPGDTIVVNGETYSANEWLPAQREIAIAYDVLQQIGWPKARIEKYIRSWRNR